MKGMLPRVAATGHARLLFSAVALATILGVLKAVTNIDGVSVHIYRVPSILGLVLVAVATWVVLRLESSWRRVLVGAALLGVFLGVVFFLADVLVLRVIWEHTSMAIEYGSWPPGDQGATWNFVTYLLAGAMAGAAAAFVAATALLAVRRLAGVPRRH